MTSTAIMWPDSIDRKWLGLQPIRIGDIAAGRESPAKYVLLEIDGQPTLRVDAYQSSGECFAFHDARLWHGLLVIGWGDCAYLIDIGTGAVIRHRLGSYFGHAYAHEEYLLVASGERLLRFNRDGTTRWTSDLLGIDGVIVLDVADGIISGEGEWDPPGDWRPFRICLDIGCLGL